MRGVLSEVAPVQIEDSFGRWTVLELNVKRSKDGRPYHMCCCSCGTVRPVLERSLLAADDACRKSRSCGCLHRQLLAKKNHDRGTRVVVGGRIVYLADIVRAMSVNPLMVSERYNQSNWDVTKCLWKPKRVQTKTTLEAMWRRLESYRKVA